jgi:uncharacterized glyoxalase superfamily protein PhnB
MSKKSRPAHFPAVMPYLTVRNARAALEFYQKAFGFAVLGQPMIAEDGTILHAELKWEEAVLMLGAEGAFGSQPRAPRTTGVLSPVGLYIYVDDVDALFARAVAAGATPEREPQDMFWGDRMCRLIDPDGHIWSFATFRGQCGEAA